MVQLQRPLSFVHQQQHRRSNPGIFLVLGLVLCITFQSFVSAQTVHDDMPQGVLLGDLDKLDPNKPPGENFDLLDWQLTLPIDTDKDKKAGGVDGSLEETLSVNRVSVTGDDKTVGRVIIGQIHATDDEPIRLYYRKLTNNTKGSIYFAHEAGKSDDVYVNMVSTRSHTINAPDDRIELNEIFSYKITVVKDTLTVTLIRQRKPNITKVFDMSDNSYGKTSEWMFFKAGVYNQNSSGEKNDFVQATFYHLHNEHQGYDY